MKQLKVYKLRYAVGAYYGDKNKTRTSYDREEKRLQGELICSAYSIVHAVHILRGTVTHYYFEVLTTWVQENNEWRLIDDKSK